MKPYSSVEEFHSSHPEVEVAVGDLLSDSGLDPAHYTLSSAYSNGTRLEASYYPREVEAAHHSGESYPDSYRWVAVEALHGESGGVHNLRVRLLRSGD